MSRGRPSLGYRKQVLIRMPEDLVDAIDHARGKQSMNAWIIAAAQAALTPVVQFTNPDVLQPIHEHTLVPSRTEWKNDQRVKWLRCTECDMEVVA